MVATLYIFGLKRGVGVDTLNEFFVRLRLQHHLGCSPTALRGVMQALEKTIVETGQAWENAAMFSPTHKAHLHQPVGQGPKITVVANHIWYKPRIGSDFHRVFPRRNGNGHIEHKLMGGSNSDLFFTHLLSIYKDCED